jgi:SAM-dependent methyltransferase
MKNGRLLEQIVDFCRKADIAESTFGRRVVNDGKLVQRLREGGRITTETLDRIQAYLDDETGRLTFIETPAAGSQSIPVLTPAFAELSTPADPQGNFRFYDNRQKYLLFVNTCAEKRVIAQRVALELTGIHPRPPAVRVFDAGVGDGTVLARVMRFMHGRFPNMPFYIAGKEISLEDVRLTLDKIPDRLYEHPASVVVLTNMYYAEAPWLTATSSAAAASMVWREVALTGTTSAEFEAQIGELQPFLSQNWRANVSPKSGNPVYERPIALVLYREDHRFLLDPIIPRPGRAEANFDLVIASQPYRAKASADFKARRVIAPLARALRPGGRLIGIHSYGHDPGMEIVEELWPGEHPFVTSRHDLLRAVKHELGSAGRNLNFNAYADNRSIFRYDMETLPNEVTGSIGTSTVFAAWNAAIYVAQIEEDRLSEVARSARYLDVTKDVLRRHNGLWFYDESYVISRRRD